MRGILFAVSMWAVNFAAIGYGQVVQLPTFQVFSVGTTVVVPDGGGAALGGVGRSRASRTTRGLPGASHLPWLSRLGGASSVARSSAASGTSVHATIIDLAEMDRKLLESTGGGEGARAREKTGKTGSLTSVRAIRARHRVDQDKRHQTLAQHFARGREAEAAGRLGAARCSYLVVARQGTGRLKQAALTRLAAMDASQR